tara:strand:- start:1078 stop:2133 length:1056 start_codon:yes stop_codon:yes gene_type:complete
MITLSHADNSKPTVVKNDNTSLDNSLILNRAGNYHVTANRFNEPNGNKTFESTIKAPGVSITELTRRHLNGRHSQENRIIVTVSGNESVELTQRFDSEGKKSSSSVIKKRASLAPSSIAKDQDVKVTMEGKNNGLAIEQKAATRSHHEFITTVIRSDNVGFFFNADNWMLWVSGGYGHYNNAIRTDGTTGIARLALNRTLFRRYGVDFGIEAGIENGVEIRPETSEAVLDALGGTSIKATIKPVLELLPTVTKRFSTYERLSAFGKLGIAYRSMAFDRDTIPNTSDFAIDLHVGLMYSMTDTINMSIVYQHVFGGSPDISSTMQPLPANNQGSVSGIPTMQALLLGINYSF